MKLRWPFFDDLGNGRQYFKLGEVEQLQQGIHTNSRAMDAIFLL
jgi:hypothetical protein